MSKTISRTIKTTTVLYGILKEENNATVLVRQPPIFTALSSKADIYKMLAEKCKDPFSIIGTTESTSIFKVDTDDFIATALDKGSVETTETSN